MIYLDISTNKKFLSYKNTFKKENIILIILLHSISKEKNVQKKELII